MCQLFCRGNSHHRRLFHHFIRPAWISAVPCQAFLKPAGNSVCKMTSESTLKRKISDRERWEKMPVGSRLIRTEDEADCLREPNTPEMVGNIVHYVQLQRGGPTHAFLAWKVLKRPAQVDFPTCCFNRCLSYLLQPNSRNTWNMQQCVSTSNRMVSSRDPLMQPQPQQRIHCDVCVTAQQTRSTLYCTVHEFLQLNTTVHVSIAFQDRISVADCWMDPFPPSIHVGIRKSHRTYSSKLIGHNPGLQSLAATEQVGQGVTSRPHVNHWQNVFKIPTSFTLGFC